MRYINETFQIPPFVNEQFCDVGKVVVEFKILDKIDESVGLEPCDNCYYDDGGRDTCDGGLCSECLKTPDDDNILDCCGYYVKVNKTWE